MAGRRGARRAGDGRAEKKRGPPGSRGRVGEGAPAREVSQPGRLELGLGAGREKGASERPGNLAGGGGVPLGLSSWPAARKAPDRLAGRGGVGRQV